MSALVLAGCAAPADKPPLPALPTATSTTPVATTSDATTATHTTTSTPPPATTPPAPTSAVVAISEFAFVEPTVRVAAGGVVTWTNDDAVAHTATADDDAFDTGRLDEGESSTLPFQQSGTYRYACAIHASMKGTVEVVGA